MEYLAYDERKMPTISKGPHARNGKTKPDWKLVAHSGKMEGFYATSLEGLAPSRELEEGARYNANTPAVYVVDFSQREVAAQSYG